MMGNLIRQETFGSTKDAGQVRIGCANSPSDAPTETAETHLDAFLAEFAHIPTPVLKDIAAGGSAGFITATLATAICNARAFKVQS